MKRNAVYGVGIGINGRKAAMQATQQALNELGADKPVLALVFVAQEFNINEVLVGLTGLLGDTPLWGFSTISPITGKGEQPRSVVVALLTGSELKAQVHWYPNYAQDSAAAARQFVQALKQDIFLPQEILLAADGINGSLEPVCSALGMLKVNVTGAMAAGEPSQGKTYGIGKNQAGSGVLSAAALGGRFRMGVGLAHGWRDLGVYFHVTRTRDVWVQTLNNQPAAEVYAHYFGYTAREWGFPPLADMARLYPLGIEPMTINVTGSLFDPAAKRLLVRSALRMEMDGSLRMSTPIPNGSVVHLMTGDLDACLCAAQQAAQTALSALGSARPLLAVALVDAAWQMLFDARPDQLSAVLQSALGEIPLVGAYTYGQLVRPSLEMPPVLHNQNLALLVIGEATGEASDAA